MRLTDTPVGDTHSGRPPPAGRRQRGGVEADPPDHRGLRARLREALGVLRLGTIVLGADDVGRAVAFWAAVFGSDVVRFPDAGDDFTLVLADTEGNRFCVVDAGHG